jgi:hypothetical protein
MRREGGCSVGYPYHIFPSPWRAISALDRQ